MYFLLLGLATLTLKAIGWGPVAAWDWWVVLAPFALAVAWWTWTDASGYTKRREMDKLEKRKQTRLDRQREDMGLKRRK
ncbi:MAG: TIGR04438 family Trp-rich protein [Pseudomonadota bacterium]